MSYTYNTDGTLASSTDARNQNVTYTYDQYQRVTQIRGYLSYDIYYDSNPFDGSFSHYASGRRTAEVIFTGSTDTFVNMYSYTPQGSLARKRMRVDWGQGLMADLEASYTYNNEGRMETVTYPDGTTYQYSFDSMGRANRLVDNAYPSVPIVQGVQYGPAGQLQQMQYDAYTEMRTYNDMLQLTHLTATGTGVPTVDLEYRFSGTQNNGRITQYKDLVSGGEVTTPGQRRRVHDQITGQDLTPDEIADVMKDAAGCTGGGGQGGVQ